MQWQVLAALTYQLADPSVVEYPSDDLPRVNWTLFEVVRVPERELLIFIGEARQGFVDWVKHVPR
jgi:hypothetical protein